MHAMVVPRMSCRYVSSSSPGSQAPGGSVTSLEWHMGGEQRTPTHKKQEKRTEKRTNASTARLAARRDRPRSQIECAPAEQQATSRVRILFVLTSFIADQRNCAVLANTLASIGCHHPREAVLVVDNASPPGAVNASIGAAGEGARASVLQVVRESFSRGQLGAWAAADRFLHTAVDGSGSRLQPELIVLLQHSTPLAAPLRMPRGCHAVALSTMINASRGGAWLSTADPGMKWASAVAQAVNISCTVPCTQQQMEAAGEARLGMTSTEANPLASQPFTLLAHAGRPAVPWAGAAHGVLALTRGAWRHLTALRLWPSPDKHHPAAQPMGHMWRPQPCAELCPKGSCSRGPVTLPCTSDHDHGVLNAGLMNGGLEKLAGILLAHLNQQQAPHPAQLEQQPQATADACYLEMAVAKVHGSNWRPSELEMRLHDLGSNSTLGAMSSSSSALMKQLSTLLRTRIPTWTCQRHDTAEVWFPDEPDFPVYVD